MTDTIPTDWETKHHVWVMNCLTITMVSVWDWVEGRINDSKGMLIQLVI